MRKAYAEFLERLKRQLLSEAASLPLEVRRDILEGRIVEGMLNAFVVRVRANAASVTNEHVDQLKAHGLSEDAIFEAGVCAAVHAGATRFEAGVAAMKGPRRAA